MAKSPENSQLPSAVAFALGFLTTGIGVIRSVEPFELIARAFIVIVVSSACGRLLIAVWQKAGIEEHKQ